MSDGPSTFQDAHYRRGVVLGLTIGEAILLLLFSLLLVLTVPLIHYSEQNKDKTSELERVKSILDSKEKEIAAKDQELIALRKRIASVEGPTGKRIEDINREYVIATERVHTLTRQIAVQERSAAAFKQLLGATNADPKTVDQAQEMEAARVLAEQVQAFKEIKDSVGDALGQDLPTSNTAQIVEAIQKSARMAKRAQLGDLDKQGLIERAATAEEREREERRAHDNTKGQFENLKQQVAEGGRGIDAIPCWSTPAGKPEYIFDVALTTRGLILRDRKLPHRREDQAKLPTIEIPFGNELGPQRFLAVTSRLFDWSTQHDCRFFVRAFDKTGKTEKVIFKRHLRFLETHFYKYEELNEQF